MALRNRTRLVRYDKFYQNVFPDAVNAAGTEVSLRAYNNATDRKNLFNQADLTIAAQSASKRAFNWRTYENDLGEQSSNEQRSSGRNALASVAIQLAPTLHPRN